MTPMLAKIIWLLMAGTWYVMRIPHVRRSRKTPIARDVMGWPEKARLMVSLTGLGLVPLGYVVAGLVRKDVLAFADRGFSAPLAWAGALVALAALVMFHLTHTALGRNWSVSLQMRDSHRLVSEGIYQRIRHPMYTAFWLWALAQALLLPNWVAGLSGIAGFGTLYLLRVGDEEQMLLDSFGADYAAYMQRTGRLWPKF
jgi:protein-S-isoprenylcysteine O-methyltransferase Ste14